MNRGWIALGVLVGVAAVAALLVRGAATEIAPAADFDSARLEQKLEPPLRSTDDPGRASSRDESNSALAPGASPTVVASQSRPEPIEGAQFREEDDRPILAAGTVIDDEGKGVVGARVVLKGFAASRGGELKSLPGFEDPPPCDGSGRFEIRGTTTLSRIEINGAVEGCWADDPVEFAPGKTDLVLRVHRGGSIEGTVVLPKGFATAFVSAVLNGSTSVPRFGAHAHESLDLGRMFKLDGLRPGSFVILVRSKGVLLREILDVIVRAGETTRLGELDLTEMKRVTLTVLDRAGRPIVGAAALERGYVVKSPMARQLTVTAPEGSNVIRIVLHARSADVFVGAPGYRRTLAPSVSADQEVVLDDGIKIAVSFPADALTKHDGVAVEAVMTSDEILGRGWNLPLEDYIGRQSMRVFTGDQSRAEVSVGEPGGYLLELHLRNVNGGKRYPLSTVVGSKKVTVAASGPAQTFAFERSDLDLAKADQILESRPAPK